MEKDSCLIFKVLGSASCTESLYFNAIARDLAQNLHLQESDGFLLVISELIRFLEKMILVVAKFSTGNKFALFQ